MTHRGDRRSTTKVEEKRDKRRKENKVDHKAKKDNESRKRDNDVVKLTSRENALNGRRKEETLVGVKVCPQGTVSG